VKAPFGLAGEHPFSVSVFIYRTDVVPVSFVINDRGFWCLSHGYFERLNVDTNLIERG
jgi:hypothetical protein